MPFVSGCHLTDVGVYLLAFVSLHLILSLFFFFSSSLLSIFLLLSSNYSREQYQIIDNGFHSSILGYHCSRQQKYLFKCNMCCCCCFFSEYLPHTICNCDIKHCSLLFGIYRFRSISLFGIYYLFAYFYLHIQHFRHIVCPFNRLGCSGSSFFLSITCIK